jgi:Tol biopolymer transport system component
MAADGSHDRVLTKEGWYGAYPAFAPDGRSVLFEATARAHAPAHLYRVSLAGGRLQQLTGGGSNQATVAEQALR